MERKLTITLLKEKLEQLTNKKVKLVESEDSERLERAKKADLITLPSNIEGTNCGNCKFFDSKSSMCKHPKVAQKVTTRMCCAYWDAEGVKREWKDNQPNQTSQEKGL